MGAQRFSQGGLIRCRALERVAEDMLTMAPDQAPGPSTADISARGLRAFFRLDSDGPTVRDGRAYFGSGLAPDPAQAPNGTAASACASAQSAHGAAGNPLGSAAGSLRPGAAGSANGGGSELGAGHGGMAPSARAADASGEGSGSGGRGSTQGAVTPAAARECNIGAGGDADVELPIVTPFSHRLQDVLQRIAAAPVRPAWRRHRLVHKNIYHASSRPTNRCIGPISG